MTLEATVGKTRAKVRRAVEERGLVSVANTSRWSRFFPRLVEKGLMARLKHVVWPEISDWSKWIIPSPGYVEILSAGPVHFREIEWIEFDCSAAGNQVELCCAAAHEAKLTAEVLGHVVRVVGYR